VSITSVTASKASAALAPGFSAIKSLYAVVAVSAMFAITSGGIPPSAMVSIAAVIHSSKLPPPCITSNAAVPAASPTSSISGGSVEKSAIIYSFIMKSYLC
jgi:hypothetical protein